MSASTNKSPVHVGLILDGNRRWAKLNKLPSLEGHRVGYDNFYKIGRYLLLVKQVPFVSAFVFSTENWSRTPKEVKYLMNLVVKALNDFLEEFDKDDVRIYVIGSRSGLSKKVLDAIDSAESKTINNKKGTLILCFNYGGQQEVADAVENILSKDIKPEEVTPELIADNLNHPDVPPLDFIIRTSGEQRISGFMLWRAAYAELYFSNKYWPDFSVDDLDIALAEYSSRHRRFGS